MKEFTEYLRERAGDSLRVISWYSDQSWGTLYVRDDLDRDVIERRVEFVSNVSLSENSTVETDPLGELGEQQAMVQVRQKAVIIRFPMNGRGGLFVSLDAEVARDLHKFVLECSERFRSGTVSIP